MASQLGITSKTVVNRTASIFQAGSKYLFYYHHKGGLQKRTLLRFGSTARHVPWRTVCSSSDPIGRKRRSNHGVETARLNTLDHVTNGHRHDVIFPDLGIIKRSRQDPHKYGFNVQFSSVFLNRNISSPFCDSGTTQGNFHNYGPLSGYCRSFHCSSAFCGEPKSKLEETVKALQEEASKKAAKEKTPPPTAPPPTPPPEVLKGPKSPEVKPHVTSLSDQDIFGLPQSQASVPVPTEPTSGNVLETKTEEKEAKLSISQKIIHEVKYFYHGFRLLMTDVRVCIRLLWLVLNGRSLTRRERRQLVRTTADLFRLVPFSVFIIVPFMEFLLPVALKLFPGMLPSTFNKERKEQEKLRIKLKTKLEMAKFLQDTVEEMAIQKNGSSSKRSVKDFQEFLTKIRSAGVQTTNEEILKYSKLFQDSLTLDNLRYEQLQALCKLLDLQPIGTAAFLRFQLRMKLRSLEADDILIQNEGIDSLAVWELQEACRQRGMRALGVSVPRLKLQLQQWLDLHLQEKVPASLLLLSRALYLPENLSKEEQLKATISTLSEAATEEARMKMTEVSGERVDNKARLESIRLEEALLKKELEEEKKEQEEAKAKKEAKEKEAKEKAAAAAAAAAQEAAETIKPHVDEKPIIVDMKEILVDKAQPLSPKKEEEVLQPLEEITTKDLTEIEEVLEQVASEKMGMKLEREELDSLKEDVTDYAQNIENLPQIVAASDDPATALSESKVAKRLRTRVHSMIEQMDGIMGELQKEKESLLEDIEVVEVRMKRNLDLREDESLRQEAIQEIQEKKKNLISINELVLAMRRLQKLPDETKLQHIMDVLDEDRDGNIDIDDVLKVIAVMGEENVKMTTNQIQEVLTLLRKEEQLKEERRQQKLLEEKQAEEAKMSEEIATTEASPSGETTSGAETTPGGEPTQPKVKEAQKQ